MYSETGTISRSDDKININLTITFLVYQLTVFTVPVSTICIILLCLSHFVHILAS
jgi:hypothetical protein